MLELKLLSFHHYGLATNNFDNSIKFHKNLGYSISDIVRDDLQDVDLIFCESKSMPSVELVRPINSRSPINNYIKKNNAIIYHACYETSFDQENISNIFFNVDYIIVSEPKPAILFNNRLVSFYFVKDNGLIELLER